MITWQWLAVAFAAGVVCGTIICIFSIRTMVTEILEDLKSIQAQTVATAAAASVASKKPSTRTMHGD